MKSSQPQAQLPNIFTDSELLKVQIKASDIEGAGMGLFATKDIYQRQYICEYYGAIIPEKYSFSEPFLMQDKMVYLNSNYCVISRSPASRVNDIVKWVPQFFFSVENEQMRNQKQLPLIEGKSRNAQIELISKDKAFLAANRPIKSGEEIYIDYGFEYWQFFFKAHMQSQQKQKTN